MKRYVFRLGNNARHRLVIEAETILEARKEIRKDYPTARFVEIVFKGGKNDRKKV